MDRAGEQQVVGMAGPRAALGPVIAIQLPIETVDARLILAVTQCERSRSTIEEQDDVFDTHGRAEPDTVRRELDSQGNAIPEACDNALVGQTASQGI